MCCPNYLPEISFRLYPIPKYLSSIVVHQFFLHRLRTISFHITYTNSYQYSATNVAKHASNPQFTTPTLLYHSSLSVAFPFRFIFRVMFQVFRSFMGKTYLILCNNWVGALPSFVNSIQCCSSLLSTLRSPTCIIYSRVIIGRFFILFSLRSRTFDFPFFAKVTDDCVFHTSFTEV